MKQFTKDDLKDGMRIEMRNGYVFYVCGKDEMLSHRYYEFPCERGNTFSLIRITHDLTHDMDSKYDIICVTDRDGTVLFEREPEKRKVTFELTEEQERELRKQLGQ